MTKDKRIITKLKELNEYLLTQYHERFSTDKRLMNIIDELSAIEAEPDESQHLPGKEKITDEHVSLKDLVLEEYKKGNLVVSTFEGLMRIPLENCLEQPVEGLLYDINRDTTTILTFINDPKWINDYALSKVVIELKKKLSELSQDEITTTDFRDIDKSEEEKGMK